MSLATGTTQWNMPSQESDVGLTNMCVKDKVFWPYKLWQYLKCFLVLKSLIVTEDIGIPFYFSHLVSKSVQHIVCKRNVLVYNFTFSN